MSLQIDISTAVQCTYMVVPRHRSRTTGGLRTTISEHMF